MKQTYRPAVFIVTYRRENGKILYLLLKRKLHWTGWEFPKGGIDEGEKKEEAAYRECFEESGQKPVFVKNFDVAGKYKYGKMLKDRPGKVGQTYDLFAAEVDGKRVRFDEKEHSDYSWIEFKDAEKKLTWSNQKRCLKIVDKWLTKKK